MSRNPSLDAGQLEFLTRNDVTTFVVRADASNAAASAAVLRWVAEHLPPVLCYAHAAGVSGFALLQDMSEADLLAVARPKVTR